MKTPVIINLPVYAILVALGLFTLAMEMPETHPCFRECTSDPKDTLTCGYNFTLEDFWVLSKACYECPSKSSDCNRLDCIPADGVTRAITVVNRIMPGPAIRVCAGDTLVVDVSNRLMGEETAIHWHGIHQKLTPWMDGVPGVTQCSIPAGSTFRYEFETPLPGSYFWHSHAGFQRGDGIAGSLVVRQSNSLEPAKYLYDFDLPEHEIMIWDWLANLSLDVFLNHHHASGDNKPRGVLINGRGIRPGFFDDFTQNETLQTTKKPFVPLYEVKIKKGYSYRIRMISNGVLNCPLAMSIENHKMTIIASDGFDVQPKTVDSLVIYAGERCDIVVKANQPIGSYFIKFQGLMDCDNRFTSAYQLAVLNYDGQPEGSYPNHIIKNWHTAAPPRNSLQLNPLNIAFGVNGDKDGRYVTAAELRSVKDDDPEIIEKPKADHQFYLSYDFNTIDNLRFHGPHIPIRTVRKGHKLYTPQLNWISHVMPTTPPLTQFESFDYSKTCNDTSLKVNCTQEYCECTHLLRVKLNSIVELVLVDRGYQFDANHPFHLHGHAFRIVGMERLNKSTEPWIIKQRDEAGLVHRIRSNAVIKDSVTVPDGGYTIVRFRADNPGFWFFHCHITYHVEVGMGLIIQVGEYSDMLQAPSDFPKCGNYLPSIKVKPPMQIASPGSSVVPLNNGSSQHSNPYHPPYSLMSSTPTTTSDNSVQVDDKYTKKPPRSSSADTKSIDRITLILGLSLLFFYLSEQLR